MGFSLSLLNFLSLAVTGSWIFPFLSFSFLLVQVTGTYSFVDKIGREVSVIYDADHKGFRARSDSLPQVGRQVVLCLNGHKKVALKSSKGNITATYFGSFQKITYGEA